MSSSEPHNLAPDQEPEKPRLHLEKIEAALIALLLVLIAAGNLIPRLLPQKTQFPLSVHHADGNTSLGLVDWHATPVPPKVIRHDLNKASRADLIDLPGIGPSLADSILAYRERHGPFRSLEDLDQVTGVGPRKLESVRQFLYVPENSVDLQASPTPENIPEVSSSSAPEQNQPETSRSSRLNLNTASMEQLMSLPGIGETYASQLLERRKQLGRFRNWNDVAIIPGVGPKRLENLQRYATIQ